MMKQKIKPFIIIMLFLIAGIKIAGGDVSAAVQDTSKTPISEEVLISGNGAKIPLGRIILVRKDSQYCAVKFTEAWTGKTEFDLFVNYESYYQGDGTGDFSKKNVQFKKEQLADRRMVGLGKTPFSWKAGPENNEIKCGHIKLYWTSRWVYFHHLVLEKEGDYGIELAPTKWGDISQVNVFDSRLKWYRYDGKRKTVKIPIDQLWEEKKTKK